MTRLDNVLAWLQVIPLLLTSVVAAVGGGCLCIVMVYGTYMFVTTGALP